MADVRTPPALTYRPLTVADAPAWERFDRIVGETDRRAERWAADELAEDLAVSWAALETRSRAAFTPDGELAGLAWLEVRPEAVRGWLNLDALPQHRGTLDEELLTWALEVAAREHRAGTLGTNVIDVDAEPQQEQRTDLLRRRGLQPVRHFLEMERDLDEPIERFPLAPGLRMVGWSDELAEPSRLAHIDAFRDHWGSSPPSPELWRLATHGSTSRPDLHRFVRDGDGAVAGYLLVGVYEHDWPVKGIRDAWVNTLGTPREWRGQGVASALLAEAMRRMREEGFSHASLGVDAESPTGATRLYERHGFVRVRTRVTWRATLD